jgi:uncharacterized protein YkwD
MLHNDSTYTSLRRIATIVVIASVAAALATGTAAASSHHGCANANATANRASTAQMRTAVVCLINKQRTSRGLPRLRASPLLNDSAQNWAGSMVRSRDFTHGSDFSARISAVGFAWSSAGENIASGYATPRQVVGAWMASPEHRANILNRAYSRVGTGIVGRVVNGSTRGATWVQDFAHPRH